MKPSLSCYLKHIAVDHYVLRNLPTMELVRSFVQDYVSTLQLSDKFAQLYQYQLFSHRGSCDYIAFFRYCKSQFALVAFNKLSNYPKDFQRESSKLRMFLVLCTVPSIAPFCSNGNTLGMYVYFYFYFYYFC